MIKPAQKKRPDYNPKQLLKRVSTNPQICHGKPCIKGHRIMVYQILDLLAAGLTPQEIAGEHFFPTITLRDVFACIAYANQFLLPKEHRVLRKLISR